MDSDLLTISDPDRLAALRQTQLLDTPAEAAFDRVTSLAARLLGVPVALISLVDNDRQFFKSCVGLPPPFDTARQTPLTHSFCKYVVDSGSVFSVTDARIDPRVCNSPLVRDLRVVAYLGIPLTGPQMQIIGTLCVIDWIPREWTAEQKSVLVDLAAFVVAEIASRGVAESERQAEIALHNAMEKLRLQEAEMRSEAKFRFLADAMPQIVWSSRPDGLVVEYYNQRWFEYTGMTFEQSQARGWEPVVHPDDMPSCLTNWAASSATGAPFETELRLKRASDQSFRWHLARSVAMRDQDGKILRWVGTSTDIHDQKTTTAALREAHDQLEHRVRQRTAELSEQKHFLQTVLENNVDGIVACDETGKLTLFNRALREMIGDEKRVTADMWAQSYQVMMPDGITPMPIDQRPLYRALHGETLRDEQIRVMIHGKQRQRRMQVNGRCIKDEHGITRGAVVAVHDITEVTAAENKFRTLFDCSSDAHMLIGETGVMDCNLAALKLYGVRDKSELSDAYPGPFVPEYQPDGHRSVEKRLAIHDIARRQGQHRFEWLLRRLDGQHVMVEITLTAIEMDGKNVLLAVLHDLTERKAAETKLRQAYASLADANLALRESEERFHTFMDYSPAAAFIKDANSRFVYVNRRFADICGSTPTALIGKSNFDVQPLASAQLVREADQAMLRANAPFEADAEPPFPTGDAGRWTMLKFPLKSSDGARMIGGIAFDVTAAKKAEAEIERQKQFIEAVIEHVSDGIIACDTQGKITCLNGTIRRLQKIDRVPDVITTEWAGENISLFDARTGNRLNWEQRPLARALRNDPVDGLEAVINADPANPVTIVASSRALTDKQGNIIGAVAGWHDVTAVRRSERELLAAKEAADAANHAKSEFLANMSHEIRTPMTAIMGYTELLDDPTQSPRQRSQHVNVIRRNGQHLLQLVSDILDLSKIEAGEMTVEQVRCNPIQLVDEIETLMRPHALGKGISLRSRLGDKMPNAVLTDPTRLRQILLNLVGNAVKFTQEGGVRIDAALEESPAGAVLRFDVSDTGIGITFAQQENLFRPFRQADGSTTRKFGGTGLGLAICKRLAAKLGGALTLLSEEGVGSTFTLVLPVQLPTDLTSGSLACPVRYVGVSGQSVTRLVGKILVAEDGIDNQRLVRLYLEAAGLNVETAINGKIAVEMVVRAKQTGAPFDAVLMDMQMPELDGYGATTELRQAGLTQLPIIAFTAHALASERENCVRSGCNDYVTKPIDRGHLIATLAKYLPDASVNADTILRSEKARDPLISTILDSYIQGLPEQIGKISQNLARADLRGLRLLVHQLKGSGGSYGFPAITTRAGTAEAAITGKEPMDRIVSEVQSLVELIRRVEGYDRTRESTTDNPTGLAASAASGTPTSSVTE